MASHAGFPIGMRRVFLPLPMTRMKASSRLIFSSRASQSSDTRRPLE